MRVLHTTAHPDDESAATLTWLARKMHARTALFSLTRGEGGQNVLGDEKYEALGLVRTGELLEACKIYGIEAYFSTAFDFGFSKTAEETLRFWGHDATLEEVVRFIRTWKPAIVVSKWQGNSSDGHGHHQAAGLLTIEAFRAAGDAVQVPLPTPARFGRLAAQETLSSGSRGYGCGRQPGDGSGGLGTNQCRGEHDPILGRSYREIGAEGYSKHRSQGSAARFHRPGRAFENFRLADSTLGLEAKKKACLMESTPPSQPLPNWQDPDSSAVPGLAQDLAAAKTAAESGAQAFRPREPEASAEAVVQGLAILTRLIQKVESSDLPRLTKDLLHDALLEKQVDFQDAANAALGIYLTARTEDPTAVPGQEIAVTVQVFNRGAKTDRSEKSHSLDP